MAEVYRMGDNFDDIWEISTMLERCYGDSANKKKITIIVED